MKEQPDKKPKPERPVLMQKIDAIADEEGIPREEAHLMAREMVLEEVAKRAARN